MENSDEASGSEEPPKSIQDQRAENNRALVAQAAQNLLKKSVEAAAPASFAPSASAVPDQNGASEPAAPRHAFWETQPVAQFTETAPLAEDGPVELPKSVGNVRKDPYMLPVGFEWSVCDMTEEETVAQVFDLLTRNYVEDDDEMFRFKYSRAFLQWALQVPGFHPDWHLGVRLASSGRLMGFITAIPARVRVNTATLDMVEINFLCVHKKLRSKRLAPVLIKEITRRVNQRGIWQAAYTAGVLLPKPLATCQYWHRSLNPKKLIDVGFSRLQARMTMARTLKLYKLPEETATPGLRPMEHRDVPQVKELLDTYLQRFALAPDFNEVELAHVLLPAEDVVSSYVVEDSDGGITDLASFYTLPSSIIGNEHHSELKAAFQYYTVATSTPLASLMSDALILAKRSGHDVFNALNLLQNKEFLKELKFGIGDGKLRYYLYNWRIAHELQPNQVGLVLL